MIWRVSAFLVILWGLGFALFMMSLGKPEEGRTTDAIVVLTGGNGRMDRGLTLMRLRAAKRMLVSGVDPKVRRSELAARYPDARDVFGCCVDLGHEAIDTISNAQETAAWVREHHYRTVRLVTSDWHMPRARLELSYALGRDIELIGDPVATNPRFGTLLIEYHKYLVRAGALMLGIG